MACVSKNELFACLVSQLYFPITTTYSLSCMYAIDYLIASYFTMYSGDENFGENDEMIQRKQVWKLSAFQYDPSASNCID